MVSSRLGLFRRVELFQRWENWLENRRRFTGGLLVLVACGVYATTLGHTFVLDDELQILQNPYVVNPDLWKKIFTGSVWSFLGQAPHPNFYRPLHIFVYWLIFRLTGPDPAAFHLFQILIYGATVWVVHRLGRELLGSELAALAAALLWAVHPLHVEAVAWIAGVPDTGYGFFYLLGFLMFLRAEEVDARPARAHALAALAFFPALFFKEMALSFPLLIVAYWFFFARSDESVRLSDRLIRLLPYVCAIVTYLLIRVAALGYVTQAGQPWRVSWRVIGAGIGLLGQHTKLFFWPTHLNFFRTFDVGSSLRSPWPWLLIAAVFAALWLRKREPVVAFLIVWWPIGLLPAVDIRQLSFPLLAERFSYVPSVSLCLLISFVLFVRLPRLNTLMKWERVTVPAMATAIVFCAAQTLRAIPNWRDNETLANYSMKQSPGAAILHLREAIALQYRHGDDEGARREYEKAMRLNWQSTRPLARVTYESCIGLGLIARRQGHFDEAVDYFRKAIRVSPHDSRAYDAMGAVYFPRGEYARAAEYFRQAVRENPNDVSGRFYLGTCWMKLGRFREAAEEFRAAREVDPSYVQAYEAEARALEEVGDAAGAARVRQLAAGR